MLINKQHQERNTTLTGVMSSYKELSSSQFVNLCLVGAAALESI